MQERDVKGGDLFQYVVILMLLAGLPYNRIIFPGRAVEEESNCYIECAVSLYFDFLSCTVSHNAQYFASILLVVVPLDVAVSISCIDKSGYVWLGERIDTARPRPPSSRTSHELSRRVRLLRS